MIRIIIQFPDSVLVLHNCTNYDCKYYWNAWNVETVASHSAIKFKESCRIKPWTGRLSNRMPTQQGNHNGANLTLPYFLFCFYLLLYLKCFKYVFNNCYVQHPKTTLIYLLCIISKMFERLICYKVIDVVAACITPYQHGFQRGLFTCINYSCIFTSL